MPSPPLNPIVDGTCRRVAVVVAVGSGTGTQVTGPTGPAPVAISYVPDDRSSGLSGVNR